MQGHPRLRRGLEATEDELLAEQEAFLRDRGASPVPLPFSSVPPCSLVNSTARGSFAQHLASPLR